MPEFVAPFCEHAARREDWIEGRPIQLENGEFWSFPLPVLDFRFTRGPQAKIATSKGIKDSNRDFSADFWKARDAFADRWAELTEADSSSGFDFVELAFPLAVDLLFRNYTMTDDQASDLLLYKPADDRSNRMWVEIASVLLGQGPKSRAAG